MSSGEQAPKVVFEKKIDGTYYVVEAVTDSKTKTNRITSAYTTKKEAYRMPDDIKSPDFTSGNEVEFTSFDNSIPNSSEKFNNVAER